MSLLSAGWVSDPSVVVLVLAAVLLYVASVRRLPAARSGPGWPRMRTASFLAGMAALLVALQSPLEEGADRLLSLHMVQHLAVTMVAAPLIVMGAPVTLAFRTMGPRGRRALRSILDAGPVQALAHPLVGWSLFAAVVVGTHFSPLYQGALDHRWLHDLEHLLFLGSGLLFWFPVIGLDPARRRLSHPLRLLYLFLAGPVNTAVALAIYSAGTVLYPHYAGSASAGDALADQGVAGVVMWLGGDLVLVAAISVVVAAWARYDRVVADRLDRRLDAEELRAPGRG